MCTSRSKQGGRKTLTFTEMVYTIRNIREVPDEQPNPSAAELGATEQQYVLGETCLTKVRNRMWQESCDVTV